ncbi:hypothetical protein PFISCL1PPCAC_10564 [Pristionchus fissidentatus]|uniref:MARVEL domain-containing protein n=1 Tax=Pristionchus fissidentatus TaxID=1538716 RepID=A0AAV5VHS4_9BILA|nr:hypothetical protein PFISCL1PPCAC_10564 [Pristionchus fissidentatus]
MAFSAQLVLSAAIKVLITILVIVVLCLVDPSYLTAYISINYEIVMIYLFSAVTLLYNVVSVVMYCIISRKEDGGVTTNHSIGEVIFALFQVGAWLLILGIGGNISQRTIIESGEGFGWIGALSGVIVGSFLCIAGIFTINVINDKILSRERQEKYSGSRYGYSAGRHY